MAPRYHAAVKKVDARVESIQNDYLNNERKWKTSTLQKIAIQTAQAKAAQEQVEKAATEEGRGATEIDEEDAEEAKEW